jgi:hypothetical protein
MIFYWLIPSMTSATEDWPKQTSNAGEPRAAASTKRRTTEASQTYIIIILCFHA